MRVAIVRRTPRASFSMDVYADGLVSGLKAVKPEWEILELAPETAEQTKNSNAFLDGLKKYYQRYWNFPNILKKQKVDIFHIVDQTDGYLVSSLKSSGQPVIITCHDLINLVMPQSFKGRARFPMLSMTTWKLAIKGMEGAEHIVSVSSHTAKDTIENLEVDPKQITVVPNAVDSIFRTISTEEVKSFRQQIGISSQTMCLLNVGSNNLRKNVSTILKVVVLLKNQGLPVHFLKVGVKFNAEQEDFIQTHNLKDCVTYLGIPEEETLVKIYNAADVLLAPSSYEGFGLTLLEAMACGTPVIASNVTSLPEVVGNAGILVDPFDSEAIAFGVKRIYEDNSYRNSLIEKGLARAKLFTWEKTAEKIAAVYEESLKKKKHNFIG